MFSIIPKPLISRRQKRMALMVSGFVDFLQIAVFPLFFEGGFSPFDDVLDVMAAISLMAICGFKWQFVVAFCMELVPFLDILPTWTAVALLLPASDGPVEVHRVQPPMIGAAVQNSAEEQIVDAEVVGEGPGAN